MSDEVIDTTALDKHVRPFVFDDSVTRSMYFSITELQSRMRLQKPDALDVEYTRLMMGFLLFDAQPRSMLMVGLGGGSLAKFCHRQLPELDLTVVEYNPHVIALRDDFLVPAESERFRVVEADGAQFLRDTDRRFDAVLVDGFDYDGQPPALCSQRFYDDCRAALTERGIFVVNLHVDHPDHALLVQRIGRSFGEPVLQVCVKSRSNAVVFASPSGTLQVPLQAALRAPCALEKSAWASLQPAFAQIVSALHAASDPDARDIVALR